MVALRSMCSVRVAILFDELVKMYLGHIVYFELLIYKFRCYLDSDMSTSATLLESGNTKNRLRKIEN